MAKSTTWVTEHQEIKQPFGKHK